jgi:hypothetical protein
MVTSKARNTDYVRLVLPCYNCSSAEIGPTLSNLPFPVVRMINRLSTCYWATFSKETFNGNKSRETLNSLKAGVRQNNLFLAAIYAAIRVKSSDNPLK